MRHAILRWVYAGICACVAVGGFQFAIEAWRAWHATSPWSASIFSGVSALFALTTVWVGGNWRLAHWLSGLTGLLFASLASLGLFSWLHIGGTRTDLAFSLAAGLAGAAGISLALLRGGGRATESLRGSNRTLVQAGVVLALLFLSMSVFPAISALSGWRQRLVNSAYQPWRNFLDLTDSVSKAVGSGCSNLILGGGGPDLPATSTRVVRLEVHAWHSGMVPSVGKRLSDLVISCEPRRCLSANGDVPVELVETFFTAVIQPGMDHIDLENLGVSKEWVHRAAAEERTRLIRESPDKAAFEAAFGTRLDDCAARTDVLRALLTFYYDPKNWWTDDYPTVTALMTLSSGSTVELSSRSQKNLMLPWRIATRTKSRLAYDARISRALAALLSRDFLERKRISGEALAQWYLQQFRYKSPAVCGNGTHTP